MRNTASSTEGDGTNEVRVTGGERIPWDCTTQVTVSDADIITNVVWTGVACLETLPIETAPVAAEGVPASDAEMTRKERRRAEKGDEQ